MLAASGRSAISCCALAGLLWMAQNSTAAQNSETQKSQPAGKSGTAEILERFVKECVSITPGTAPFPPEFQMGGGSTATSLPVSTVPMVRTFRICQFETTQELYEAVMGRNPSRWKGPRNSVEMLTWQDADEFCRKLTAILRSHKLISVSETVRLPSEAEWEYCCRAGTETVYSFGDKATTETDRENAASILNEYAWHTGNAAGNDPEVGSLKPNAWKLYDMHGYLWEFVSADAAQSDRSGKNSDPGQTEKPATRIIRGGSWRDPYSLLTSASRANVPEQTVSDAIGFRCVIAEVPQQGK